MQRPSTTTFANLFDKLAADARRLAGETYSADDLYQDAVLYVLEHGPQFDGQTASYIRQRCYWETQHALDKARLRSRNLISLTEYESGEAEFISEEPNPEELAIIHETESENRALVVRLLECTQQLPARQRQIIQLLAQGQRQHQIAERLHITRPAVQQCLARARASLGSRLNRQLQESPDG